MTSYLKIYYLKLLQILLQTVMTDQLDKLKQENIQLKDELKSLRQKHQYTIMELSDIKESENRLKKLNDNLVNNINQNTINLEQLDKINLVLNGQFTSQKITELQRQLDKYRQGVNNSVDRRVRQIIQGYNQMEEQDKNKIRSNSQSNNVNINYHLVNRKGDEVCQTCQYLKEQLAEKENLLREISVQFEEEKADTSILSAKLSKMEALADTLKQQNQILTNQISRLEYELSQQRQLFDKQCTDRTYEERPPKLPMRVSSLRNGPSSNKDKQNMMRQIANIASGFSSSRKAQLQDRSRSRALPIKDTNTLFSIKNGINRPNQIYF